MRNFLELQCLVGDLDEVNVTPLSKKMKVKQTQIKGKHVLILEAEKN